MNESAQFVSYAQHGEDVILWRALGDREGGFYVDVGAFDPTDDSVTRALYERGWRGINIEPQPDLLEAFERERPDDINLSLAIGDHDGTATLTRHPVAGWATTLDPVLTGFDSATDRTIEVPLRRLDTLLPELGVEHVDILKIDVEGAEPEVVRGFIESSIRPLVCVVEGVAPGVGRAAGDEAVALLVEAGYLHCMFDGLNHYLTTDPTLRPALSLPANPIDGHTLVGFVRLEQERRELHATIAALATENLGLRAVPAPATVADGQLTAEPVSTAPAEATPAEEEEKEAQTEIAGRDVPPTTPETPDVEVEVAAVTRSTVHARNPSNLDPVVRTARRRVTFARLLRLDAAPMPPSATDGPLPSLLKLAVTDQTPVEAISLLYLAIFGREADPVGLAGWSARFEGGDPLIGLARELASSDEALGRSPEHQAQVLADLKVWESLVALTELGVAAWHPDRTHSPGNIAHEIFVEALFEVALQRHPSANEAESEIAKLVGGSGRERLLCAYAARPEVRSRLLGEPVPGLPRRLNHGKNERRQLETFREMVAAAEGRYVTHLIAILSPADPLLRDLLRAKPTTSEDH